jgi:putative nucleotidyltransferase with HDIG domain
LDCENFEQDNPWHIYNVLDHILHSVENMNEMTGSIAPKDRRMLAYVMLFHDIGKPQSHIRRIKHGREIDSFFGHNEVGSKIAQKELGKLGFSDDEVFVMAKLILDHDMFINLTLAEPQNQYQTKLTEDFVQNKIEKLDWFGDGAKLMQYLVFIGMADNQAQNPNMTEKSTKLLEKYDEILQSINDSQKI